MIKQLDNIFRRNKIQKFTALAVATALWFYVMSSQDPAMTGSYTVPVSVINTPRDVKATVEDKPIKVELKGARSNFAEYHDEDIHATVDIANLTEGEYDLPISVAFPKGFDLVDVTPDKLHVTIEPYVDRQINAEVIVTGSKISDAVIMNVSKSLETVTVVGAKTEVEKVQRIIGYVGLTDNEEDFEMQVPLSAVDSDGREVKNVRIVPSTITVKIDLETGVDKKTVPVTADITLPSGKTFSSITVEPNQIEITGKKEILEPITEIKTVPLTLPAVHDNFHGTLKINLPEGVTTSVDKVTVTAELKK